MGLKKGFIKIILINSLFSQVNISQEEENEKILILIKGLQKILLLQFDKNLFKDLENLNANGKIRRIKRE